ncbi:MAG TPA: CapA family protein, partial [Mobilitalea sp.]|nr:CapA family protein [Mobilitalea sp.]
YEDEFSFPLYTPSWTFNEGSLVRWSQFPLISDESVSTISDAVQIDPEDDLNQVKLLAVGDNLIHIEVVNSGKQADGSYNFDHLYSNLAKDISAADIAVVNQETILGGATFAYSGYPSFNSPTEIGDALANVGFDVVLHATNHTMDMGLKAVENTLAFWSNYPEIKILGINGTKEDKDTIPIVTKNGIKLALLNYTYSLNGYKLPEGMPYLVNLLDKKQMTKDIIKAKELADFVIVFPHWGSEYVYEATSIQKDLTALYYELGVDLVIGTHPHVLEPVEWVETEPGHRMLVYYSLGNFMSYQKEAPRMLGGLANITISKDADKTYISEASITPIVTHYEHGPADYKYGLYKLSDYTPEQAMLHGVSDIAQHGAFTYDETYALAKKVLGSWFTE